MNVGEFVKKARKEAHLTQKELAKKTNLSRSHIGAIETNRYNPSLATLQLIANATGTYLPGLLGAAENLSMKVAVSNDNSELSNKKVQPATPSYYNDPEVAELADRLKNQPGMHMLFDASRNMTKQDIEAVVGLIKQFKGSD